MLPNTVLTCLKTWKPLSWNVNAENELLLLWKQLPPIKQMNLSPTSKRMKYMCHGRCSNCEINRKQTYSFLAFCAEWQAWHFFFLFSRIDVEQVHTTMLTMHNASMMLPMKKKCSLFDAQSNFLHWNQDERVITNALVVMVRLDNIYNDILHYTQCTSYHK